MSTFTLNWDNSLVLASINSTDQIAYYRQSGSGSWLSTGFSPANALPTSAITTSISLAPNIVWEFKVSNVCGESGVTDNDNGTIQQIVFECITPTPYVLTSTTLGISINVVGLNITKILFKLRKQGDDSLVSTQLVTASQITTTHVTFTGLTENTAYYFEAIFYATVNGVEVSSADSRYLNAVCGGNIVDWKFTTDALPTANLIFSWNRLNGETVNLTSNINGSFTSVDWGDGTINTSLTHTYIGTANYTVKIYGSTATNITLSFGVDALRYHITAFTAVPSTLTHFDVNNNLITVPVNLSGAVSLVYLDYAQNALTSFPDISSNILLNYLYLNSNNISGTYDFTLNTALIEIVLSINSISGVTGFSTCLNLSDLEFGTNGISVSNVNSALIALDANGVINGRFISNSQSPVAAPTGLGATAKTNLIGKGWLMNTD